MRYLKHLYRLNGITLLILFMLTIVGGAYAQDQGDMVADMGFRPDVNGFAFENYGPGNNDLTAVEMQRMFGDVVCDGGAVEGDEGCDLTPTAQMWMQNTNEIMANGHCEGMAALSLLFYTGTQNTDDFGGSGDTDTLSIEGNDLLQREIAFWWATQITEPTYTNVVNGTPSELVNILIDAMNNQGETFTVEFRKRDGSGGHAITPYAVTDQGDGIYWIMVYDNNWPGQERHVEVDTNAETWQYNAAINPDEPESLYEGDAETQSLFLTPTSPRMEIQNCPFCGDAGNGSTDGFTSVGLNAAGARLTVTDDKGNVTGYVNGEWVNNIPGAKMLTYSNIFIRGVLPPQITFPEGSPFKITATEGPNIPPNDKATFTVIRSGSIIRVGGIDLSGSEDTLNVDGSSIQYTSGDGGETPVIEQGITTAGNDYHYVVEGHSAMSDNGTLDFSFNPETGDFKVGGSDANQYSVNVDRIDDQGNASNFFTDNLDVGAGENANLNASEWQDGGQITGDITGTDGADIAPLDLQDEQAPTDVNPTDNTNEQATGEPSTESIPDTGTGDQGAATQEPGG